MCSIGSGIGDHAIHAGGGRQPPTIISAMRWWSNNNVNSNIINNIINNNNNNNNNGNNNKIWPLARLAPDDIVTFRGLVLRGVIVNRTYVTHKKRYIYVFIVTTFGPVYYNAPQ